MTTTGPPISPDLRAIPGRPGACPPGEGISSAAAPGDFWPVLPPTLAGDLRQPRAPRERRWDKGHEAERPRRGRLDQVRKL